MPVNDELGKRMKTYYEQIPKTKLMRRTPVMIRIDGKAFHTYTKGFARPFDEILMKTMQETTKYLCENIQGCVLGYTQSDEISLVLVDYQKLDTSAWFDYEVQKMCSVTASMATMAFNRYFQNNVDLAYQEEFYEWGLDNVANFKSLEDYNMKSQFLEEKYDTYYKKVNQAMFDARVFNIPKEEVTNCIYWRQLDATRNSIQMVGQTYFSHKELIRQNCSDIQDMLMEREGINWNNYPIYQKRGTCVVRNKIMQAAEEDDENIVLRDPSKGKNEWIIDKEIPIFKNENREYIEALIRFE